MLFNNHCRRQHLFLRRHQIVYGEYVEKELIGCGLHILNLGDVTASKDWRIDDEDADIEIGGRDTSE
eukprot:SAG25_NODE_655_length_6126_cov_12.125270_6_plen_67_part_00